MENEFSTTIVINRDGSATTTQVIRQPIVTVTSTGQRLVMPRCAVDPPNSSIPKEWNLRTTATNTGKDCVITITLSAENIQMLTRQLQLSGGDIVESNSGFTIKIYRNDPDGSTPGLIRAVLIYKYLITVPFLEEFSNNGIKQAENQVSWSTSSRSHSIWIKGRLPRAGPGDTPRPYLGCWSSSSDSNVLYITPSTIQSAHSYKPLPYKEAYANVAKNLFSLRVLEFDESKEFHAFLGLQIAGQSLQIANFESYPDYLNGKNVGTSESWHRDDCKQVLSRLKSNATNLEGSQSPGTINQTQPSTTPPKKDSQTKKKLKDIWNQIKKPN